MSHKWTLIDDFTASKQHDDGTTEEKKFTSHAMARQFVEQHTGQILSFRHKPSPGHSKNRESRLTPAQQQKLKDEAMKQFKGI